MPRLLKATRIVGDTRHVFYGTQDDLAAISAAIDSLVIPNGHAVVREDDGSSVFVRDEVVFDPTQEGSARFTWDASGNRVKHARIEHRISADGVHSRRVLRHVYKAMT